MIRDWMRAVSESGSPPRYGQVMALDVRDSIFQGDPFAPTGGGPGFWAFQEAKPRTVRECGWNSGWVKDCYGAEGLQLVGGSVISCSGTSIANWEAMFAYAGARVWARECLPRVCPCKPPLPCPGSDLISTALERPGCERNGADQVRGLGCHRPLWVLLGADQVRGRGLGMLAASHTTHGTAAGTHPACTHAPQGIHNYLVYSGDLADTLRQLPTGTAPDVHLVTNEEGWIATIQSMPQVGGPSEHSVAN